MTQQTIYGLGHSNTNKKFKFVLSTKDYGSKTLRYAPQGWDEGELTFIRDKTYKGVIESYSTNELTFVKDGRDYIQTAYEYGGIDYEISITIYILNNSTFKYSTYFTGKLDLSTYKIDSIGVTCEVVPSGFQDVVLKRDEIDVDMMSRKFIGGGEISMDYLSGVYEAVTIPEYQATQNADWRFNGSVGGVGNYSHYLPMTNFFNEFLETEVNTQEFNSTTKFFVSDGGFTGTIKGNLGVFVLGTAGNLYSIDIYLRIRTSGGATSTVSHYNSSGTMVINETFTVNESVSLGAGDSLYFEGYLTGVNATLTYSASSVSLFKSIGDLLPEISPNMYYIYEAFLRTIQLISGKYQPFYSALLGRTDSVFENYAEDGEASLITITNGKWIRKFDPRVHGLNFNLKDLFKTINAVYNIGLEFTIDPYDREVVRIEKEQYFFDIEENEDFATDGKYWKVNQILDLSSWLNNEMISKEVLPDWYANEVQGGYSSFEYENVQGLKEFNVKSSWAIPIKSVKSKYDIQSPYRADTQGVNKLRAKPYSSNPTEDVSGDNDIFIFDVKRGGLFPFTVKTNEDFSSVSGGVDPQECYNLNFTPRRNLERHGNHFTSMQLAAGDEIQWLKNDKNSNLVTQRSDESSEKIENGDVLVNDLPVGYWIPEAYVFDVPVNLDTITAIKANPRGVIKIASDKWGWILEVQTNNEDKKGSFKLLRVDTDNVKIVTS